MLTRKLVITMKNSITSENYNHISLFLDFTEIRISELYILDLYMFTFNSCDGEGRKEETNMV